MQRAKIGILAMGSTVGTLRAGMADFAAEAGPARLIALRSFRPFPTQALPAFHRPDLRWADPIDIPRLPSG